MFRPRSRSVLGIALVALLGTHPASARSAAPFQVQGLFQFGPAHFAVAFTDSVDIASVLQPAHYVLTPQGGAPALTIQSVALQENQRTVVLTTTAALPASRTYGVAVSGVTSRHGDALVAGGPASFTTVAETVTGIADVHANINALIGKTVTLVGQIYIRASSSGGTPSAYLQDGTGRGLNLFGGALQPASDSLGSVVKATGTVALYFTTVELTPFTATAIASRMPHLGPRVLTVPQASSPQWEGTYVQTTATLTFPGNPSGSSNYNYNAADEGVAFIFRVRNSTGIPPSSFAAGDVVTGAGAGANFSGTYQLLVGNAADFYKGRGPGDITPPVIVSAAGTGGASAITLEFSEPIGAGGSTAANYTVYPAGSPGAPLGVTSATVSGSTVTLALDAPLVASTDYTVEARNVQDTSGNPIATGATLTFTAAVPVPFRVAGIFPFGADRVGVAFTKPVNAGQALDLGHYAFTPALSLAAAKLQENGQTVILRSTAPLPKSTTWSVAVSGVTSSTGEALSAGATGLATSAATIVNLADVQANLGTYSGQTVSFVGQVTIPVGSRGGTPSGYLQDGSERGINLFGGTIQGAVNQLGSVAEVTGTVTPYFTTTEVTNYTATGLATGLPHLGARPVTVAEAGSATWEGTYIETSGTIASIDASGASNVNYVVNDAGAAVTFRVGNGLGILASQFAAGDLVTGRGAGGSFQSTWQVNVGNRADFFLAGGGGPDVTPPVMTGASGADRSGVVAVSFSEPLRSNEATVPSNWTVRPSAAGSTPLSVLNATLSSSGRTVTLTVNPVLTGDVAYLVTATGVRDLAGNEIAAGASVSFTATAPVPQSAVLEIPAKTLVRNLARQGEVMSLRIGGVPGTKAICRIFDVQGRLVRVLFDGTLTGTPRRTLTWDGRDDTFEFVPAGLYICHLQTTDPQGSVSQTRAPIVVAVRLQ